MDALSLHRKIVSSYQDYIRSFIDIREDDIRDRVEEELANGTLWPEPLIQFNPSFEKNLSIEDLVGKGILHNELRDVFRGYRLYTHQVRALTLGANRQSFIVTSGTGSGKSLTYLGTIFNALFATGYGQGTKALIVYPMNALINSQVEELKKFSKNYQSVTGKAFPIRFAAYTGQTGDEERAEIVKNAGAKPSDRRTNRRRRIKSSKVVENEGLSANYRFLPSLHGDLAGPAHLSLSATRRRYSHEWPPPDLRPLTAQPSAALPCAAPPT